MSLLRVGTRGSALAMAQAGDTARTLSELSGVRTELVPVTTHGDVSRESLASLGGTGVFASALREFLLAGQCDLVIHSMKDLPTAQYAGLSIGAVPPREDARDTLCARDGLTLDTLPPGSRVGTGSPRRIAQVKNRRQDLEVVDIRGNVDTRLGFVASGELDAVVLAAAGLSRLGRLDSVTEYLELADWPTAPSQGALAIEVRTEDLEMPGDSQSVLRDALNAVTDAKTAVSVTAERAVLARLEAGCAAPVGVHAVIVDGVMTVDARVYSLDGQRVCAERIATEIPQFGHGFRASAESGYDASITLSSLDTASRAGTALADSLLAAGAAELAPLRHPR